MRWLTINVILAIHGELLVEHGGLDGTYNEEALESTLVRPQQLISYAENTPSLHELAASYAYGFSRNHCFTDGNKRITLAAIDVFLQLNGHELVASEVDAVDTMMQLAAGKLEEMPLGEWISANMCELKNNEI